MAAPMRSPASDSKWASDCVNLLGIDAPACRTPTSRLPLLSGTPTSDFTRLRRIGLMASI